MAVTTMNNMVNPEVMGAMIDAKIDSMLKLTPYAKVDTSLVGVAGDTKTVPSWNYIGDAEDIAEGVEVGLTTMTASSTTFTIKKAMKSVGITQEAVNSGLGNPIGQAEKQLAKSIASKVDNDVLNAVYTASMYYAPNTLAAISYDGVVDASTKFLDEEDGIEKVLFINPDQEATLLKDADFLSADKFTAGVAVNGSIGKVAGCWVKKSNKVREIRFEKSSTGTITIVAENGTEGAAAKKLSNVAPYCLDGVAVGDKVNAASAAYYLCPIIKLEADNEETDYTEDELPAVTIFLKKDTTVDSDYIPRKQITEVTASKYYGVALTNDSKVVLAKYLK